MESNPPRGFLEQPGCFVAAGLAAVAGLAVFIDQIRQILGKDPLDRP